MKIVDAWLRCVGLACEIRPVGLYGQSVHVVKSTVDDDGLSVINRLLTNGA